ncbi:MAG: ABC transporter permease [Burkholderiales bacterium]|nr:ABC transporter permease [Burkholderiales bacterium]
MQWLRAWWRIIRLGARVLALALSAPAYAPRFRRLVLARIYLGTAPLLLWFTVLSSLLGLVIIRIVVVTATSYGLSQYALQMVVRVLVLELIPLTAAIFVALRVALPDSGETAALRARGVLHEHTRAGVERLVREVAPRVAAGVFAVVALAAVSGVVTLILAYLTIYGFVGGGLAQYTRTVGHVFHPSVTLVFVLKTFFLSLAVGLIPVGSALYDAPQRRSRSSMEIRVLVRLFLVILLIEAVSLVGNYY